MAGGNGTTEKPVISVSLITYNHEPYIRACLDSILAQQVGVPFEVCLGEDGSTDGTREICSEYAAAHRDRIRLVLRDREDPERGKYASQGVYNYIETTRMCRGKYVAFCDGDDLWIDPLKLQKQFDVMESDHGISLVHSDCELWDEASNRLFRAEARRWNKEAMEDRDPKKMRQNLICSISRIAASTTFARTKDVLDVFDRNIDLFRFLPMGDTPTWCELMDYGRACYIDESLAVYRILPESDSNSKSAERKFRFVNGAADFGMLQGGKYRLPMDAMRSFKIKNCNRYALLSGEFSEIRKLYTENRNDFSPAERMVYRAGQLPVVRAVAKNLFRLRYQYNNWRFKLS